MPLVKQDLVNDIIENIGFRQNEAKNLVNDFFNQIKEGLARDGEVKLSGFGNFTLLDKKPRVGRNPKTKEEFEICARTVVSFKPGVKFKKIVQEQGIIGNN